MAGADMIVLRSFSPSTFARRSVSVDDADLLKL